MDEALVVVVEVVPVVVLLLLLLLLPPLLLIASLYSIVPGLQTATAGASTSSQFSKTTSAPDGSFTCR